MSTRRRGYARAYIDRDATSDDGPLRFVAATEGEKGDGIDLRMSGARLERYRSNPIVGYGHRYFGRESLPIGKSDSTTVDGNRLLMDVTFDRKDEFAKTVDRKYRDGYLNAVSIGFDVLTWEDPKSSYWTGGVATEWELFELSAVPLPMDADAVVESGRAFDDQLLDTLRAQLDRMEPGELAGLLRKLAESVDAHGSRRTADPAQAPAVPASRLVVAQRRLRLATLGT